MNLTATVHVTALAVNLGLGLAVYRTNTARTTNRLFLVLSSLLALWLGCLALAFVSQDTHKIAWTIRGCHVVAAFFPLAFNWLRLSILHPSENEGKILRRAPLWLLTSLIVSALSPTDLIVRGATLGATHDTIPEPVLGPLFNVYVVFYILSLGLLIWRFYQSLHTSKGIPRAELQFILFASAIGLVIAFGFIILAPMLIGSSQSVKLGPFSIIALDGIIAYGIATRRIMDMAYLFRLLTSYGLLTVYLGIIYAITFYPLQFLARYMDLSLGPIPHFLAALTVAFSLAPMNGVMQRFANRMFVRDAPLNMESVVQLANRLLRSISTVDRLLSDFADTVAKAVGTDQVVILLARNDRFIQQYQSHETPSHLVFSPRDAVPVALMKSGEAIVPEVLKRLRPSAYLAEACNVMEQYKVSIALGLHSKERMEGILFLGPKLSGRIYGAPEQHALQLLCNQLAIALNNARLYTQVQDAKIYNDMLVDNLASGVVAADTNGVVTVFNREAQRITGRSTEAVLRQPSTTLPGQLAELLSSTLAQGQGQRDQEMVLSHLVNQETPIRVSSSVFYSHTCEILGAFLVINDLTVIKQLELQVRRTDRLASLGTLAAGMAHEIKNPLVSIKTFTQLLPERYEDSDFRETFFSLVGGEVKRIDRIVNQLLRFSRPAKPNLTATRLHEVLDSALKLMSQQLRQNNIHLVRSLDAPDDSIRAAGDQLSQAFINLLLNAIEAMGNGGTLTVRTAPAQAAGLPATFWSETPEPRIEVTIRDTGEGIAADSLPHIFDPFFTTKSQGTGLGLSVAHGIVQEHDGIIDVASEAGQGTTFTVILPLMREEQPS
jgi:signal transduction histidine kinase